MAAYSGTRCAGSRIKSGFASENDDVAAQTVAIEVEGYVGIGLDMAQFEFVTQKQ